METYYILTPWDAWEHASIPNARRVVPLTQNESLVLTEDETGYSVSTATTDGVVTLESRPGEFATRSEGGRWMLRYVDAVRKARWRPI